MHVQSDVSKFVVDHAHLPELCSNVALRMQKFHQAIKHFIRVCQSAQPLPKICCC